MSYAARAREALTSGLVDDAGLFPPEQLAMGPALDRYRRNLAEADPVLSHRFICPASRLDELAEQLGADDQIDLSLILDEPYAAVDLDPRIAVLAVEVPPQPPDGWERNVPAAVPVFVEVMPADVDWASLRANHWLAKIRCGGATADIFPSADELAGFLREIVRRDWAFKATAGLHHAVSYRDPVTGLDHYGFLNLLLALFRTMNWDRPRAIAAVLIDQDELAIAEQAKALPEHAAHALRNAFLSYGSCSTSEPIEDLRRLGLHPNHQKGSDHA